MIIRYLLWLLALLSCVVYACAQIVQFSGASVGGGVAVPTMVQHTASTSNVPGITGGTGSSFAIPIPNPIGLHNVVVLGITYPVGSTPTISDNNGNSWPGSAVAAVGGNNVTAVYVLPNANAGQTTITVAFGGAIAPFQYIVTEYNNVATMSPVSGTVSAVTQVGASISTGSFTPTNNNSSGGNIIWNYYALDSSSAFSNPSSWVSGGSFTLLDANVSWTNNQGFPAASQWMLQTTSAAVNPGITATGDTVDPYNAVAVALKAANAGTARPAGIHVDKLIHVTPSIANPTTPMQLPVAGNLRILTFPDYTLNVTGITDNESGTWTNVGGANSGQIWYSANKPANANLMLTIAVTGRGGTTSASFRFYDVSSATASPFNVSAQYNFTTSNGGVITGAPVITPTQSNGLVVATLGFGTGPAFSVTSPVGAVFDICVYTGMTDNDAMGNADGAAHIYNSSTSSISWDWTSVVITNNSTFATAAAFK